MAVPQTDRNPSMAFSQPITNEDDNITIPALTEDAHGAYGTADLKQNSARCFPVDDRDDTVDQVSNNPSGSSSQASNNVDDVEDSLPDVRLVYFISISTALLTFELGSNRTIHG
jgi:hypothetical protein